MSAHVSCDHSRATAHFAGGATHPAISITQQTKTRSTHDRFEHTRGTISITSPNLHGGILGWCLAHRKQKPTHRKHPAFRRVKRGPTCLVDFCIAVVIMYEAFVKTFHTAHPQARNCDAQISRTRIVHCCHGAVHAGRMFRIPTWVPVFFLFVFRHPQAYNIHPIPAGHPNPKPTI